ncbi:uncharacterized protein LOC122368544, partial [Amphibalanus amphitrite]|uniref:uncharacterized protein LOC122368544 n=1 Tax=Amphibalanus amphitrite TaxID=1232801 RepID=UPI001C906410
PRVSIESDSQDLFVNAGSTVEVRCVIALTVSPPAHTFWYQDGGRVVPDGARLRVLSQRSNDTTSVSTLRVERARLGDSGNYTCAPSSLPAASVRLHVLNGEHHAAMQDGVSAGWPARRSPPLWPLCLTLLLVLDALSPATRAVRRQATDAARSPA